MATAVAACLLIGGIGTPAMARPTPAHELRTYDKNLLFYVNRARAAHHLPPLRQSDRLYRIAHAWATHMAQRHAIKDNPRGVHQAARSCPGWHAYGENVAAQEGTDAHAIFELYMHDRAHRRTILRRRYHFTDIGIATVKVVRDGQTTEWNVMDLANHCG
jgi:uncharacterized protein YkwD